MCIIWQRQERTQDQKQKLMFKTVRNEYRPINIWRPMVQSGGGILWLPQNITF